MTEHTAWGSKQKPIRDPDAPNPDTPIPKSPLAKSSDSVDETKSRELQKKKCKSPSWLWPTLVGGGILVAILFVSSIIFAIRKKHKKFKVGAKIQSKTHEFQGSKKSILKQLQSKPPKSNVVVATSSAPASSAVVGSSRPIEQSNSSTPREPHTQKPTKPAILAVDILPTADEIANEIAENVHLKIHLHNCGVDHKRDQNPGTYHNIKDVDPERGEEMPHHNELSLDAHTEDIQSALETVRDLNDARIQHGINNDKLIIMTPSANYDEHGAVLEHDYDENDSADESDPQDATEDDNDADTKESDE